MPKPIKSRRGVYYDLEKSPYGYKTPFGDLFKFSSKKKLEIYERDIKQELQRLEKLLDKHDMRVFIPDEIINLLRRAVYESFYKSVEG